jgi:hypothetical protein
MTGFSFCKKCLIIEIKRNILVKLE